MIPRDEWIIGEGIDAAARWYVIHTREPRFIAEVCDEDEAPLTPLSWVIGDGQIITSVVFYDDPPAGEELDRLMFGLREILDDYDTRAERRLAREQRELDDEL